MQSTSILPLTRGLICAFVSLVWQSLCWALTESWAWFLFAFGGQNFVCCWSRKENVSTAWRGPRVRDGTGRGGRTGQGWAHFNYSQSSASTHCNKQRFDTVELPAFSTKKPWGKLIFWRCFLLLHCGQSPGQAFIFLHSFLQQGKSMFLVLSTASLRTFHTLEKY